MLELRASATGGNSSQGATVAVADVGLLVYGVVSRDNARRVAIRPADAVAIAIYVRVNVK